MAPRAKMAREERAKQFMPFAALKGYQEALQQKERIVVPKLELSEDYAQELDRRLQALQKMDMVTVVYFQKGAYLKLTGVVSRIDITARILKIVNTKIAFDDILELSDTQLS